MASWHPDAPKMLEPEDAARVALERATKKKRDGDVVAPTPTTATERTDHDGSH